MEVEPKMYQVAQISLTNDGIWVAQFLGRDGSRGGVPIILSSTKLSLLLAKVKSNLNSCKKGLLRRIEVLEAARPMPEKEPEKTSE